MEAASRVTGVVGIVAVLALSACGSSTGPDGPSAGSPGEVPMLVEPECDDGDACAVGFVTADTFYGLSCGAVRPDVVSEETLARGELSGEEVEVRSVEGVSSDVLVAVSVEGGLCDHDDVPLSPWSLAFPMGASHPDVEAAICAVVVDEHRARNNCE